jgi:hypothetical protein
MLALWLFLKVSIYQFYLGFQFLYLFKVLFV